jgi:succinate dehydrogenase / fumarate reductase, iron-sulfur subunit
VTTVEESSAAAGRSERSPRPDDEPDELIDLTLHVWRQAGPDRPGRMVRYEARGISTHMSFLEMLDVVNERLIKSGEDPIAFDHDCREGICGTCGLMINGIAHGPQRATTTCQLHMRHFKDGETVYIEPWRAEPFPVLKDLIVDRAAFDRIIEAGGYITAATGGAPEANGLPVPKGDADIAMDAAACIGCGACVAACPNGSAMLFTAAKVTHLNVLPQGQAERWSRTLSMVATQDSLGFGGCTNIGECAAVCPKEISMETIARLNRDLIRASRHRRKRR